MRGPATVPSLVTWPTRATQVRPALATSASRVATSRTWPTLPAGPVRSAEAMVWTLSTTASAGATDSIAPTAVASSVVATRPRPLTTAPTRSARPRTWEADSSPVMYRTSEPPAARRAASCSSSVLLPMPGSPPNSTIEPGTRPPPSTRSTSPIPLTIRSASALDSSEMGEMAPTANAAVVRSRARAAATGRLMTVSTSVFHASHDGHCPAQRGVSAPHCWQTCTVRTAGMGEPCCHAAEYRRRIGPLSEAQRALTVCRSGFFSIERPPSGMASTMIVSPASKLAISIRSASGSSIWFWISRRSGRAPKALS